MFFNKKNYKLYLPPIVVTIFSFPFYSIVPYNPNLYPLHMNKIWSYTNIALQPKTNLDTRLMPYCAWNYLFFAPPIVQNWLIVLKILLYVKKKNKRNISRQGGRGHPHCYNYSSETKINKSCFKKAFHWVASHHTLWKLVKNWTCWLIVEFLFSLCGV